MKIIAGHSTENSISFASNRVKITLYDDYKVEYLPYVVKEKKIKSTNRKTLEDKIMMCDKNSLRAKYLLFIKKIRDKIKRDYPKEDMSIVHKMGPLEYLFLIGEIFFIVMGLIFHIKIYSRITAVILWLYSVSYIIRAIVTFTSKDRLRKIHGAEHMTYNASLYENVNKENILKRSRYCRHCGSVKPANLFFLETINLVIAFVFSFWIPHTLIMFIAMNIFSTLPLNFFAYFYQKFLTSEPGEEELFLANLCYEILRETEILIDNELPITPIVLKTAIAHSAKTVLSKNNYDVKNPFV